MFALAAVRGDGSVVTWVLRAAAMILVPSQSNLAMCSKYKATLAARAATLNDGAWVMNADLYVHSARMCAAFHFCQCQLAFAAVLGDRAGGDSQVHTDGCDHC